MPVAGQVYTKKVILPNYPEEAYVEVQTNPKVELWEKMDLTDKSQATYVLLSNLITDWNFTDSEGNKLAVTVENIRLALSIFDMAEITKNFSLPAGLDDAKKNS